MSKYLQNDGQMWGSYDFVDHGHEVRKHQPALQHVVAKGDYDFGPGPLAQQWRVPTASDDPSGMVVSSRSRGRGQLRGFGEQPGFKLPDLGALQKPTVRGALQYADQNVAPTVVQGLTWTSLNVQTSDQSTKTGTLAPVLPTPETLAKNWVRDAVGAGGAVLYELASVMTLSPKMAVTSDPAAVLKLAHVGGPLAVLAIAPTLEQDAQVLGGQPMKPGLPSNMSKLVVGGILVAIAVGVGYAMTQGRKPYKPRVEAI